MKRILVPVYSVGIGQRLLDVAELLDPDPRLHLVFAGAPTATANGVEGLLREAGVATLAWHQALGRPHDLVITTSHEQSGRFGTPTVVIPDPRGRLRPPHRNHAGPTAIDTPSAGRTTPTAHALTLRLTAHRQDLQAVQGLEHGLVDQVTIVGDLTFDRLVLSTHSRETYRAALRVDARHQLVVVVSRWGTDSLITREPELLHRLTVELPDDRYRIAVLLHPAAWFSHDVHHLRAWMSTARTASVQVIDPFTQWRPIIAAADMVIGACGSITLYSTGIGLPVLFADPAPHTSTAAHHILPLDDVPHLRHDILLSRQLDIATHSYTRKIQRLALGHITSAPGQAGHLTRAAIYRMLTLAQPTTAPMITPIRGPRRML